MARGLDRVLASLPAKRCARIEQRANEPARLKDLREAVERTQTGKRKTGKGEPCRHA
ncbi:MAG: hypothetical protein ACREVR_20855 [Burkholderiales bacterium]